MKRFVGFRFTDETIEKLERMAAKTKLSKSDVVTHLITSATNIAVSNIVDIQYDKVIERVVDINEWPSDSVDEDDQ